MLVGTTIWGSELVIVTASPPVPTVPFKKTARFKGLPPAMLEEGSALILETVIGTKVKFAVCVTLPKLA